MARRAGDRERVRAGVLAGLLVLSGCAYYSFTGAAIPEHLRTVAVPLVEDRSAGGVPDLDRALTDALVDRFVNRTRLVLEPDEEAANAVVLATIERYATAPVAVTGDEVAALNRVTIAVAARFVDRVEERDRLRRTFTATADYDPAEALAGEADAAARALDQIAGDVFNAATSDW